MAENNRYEDDNRSFDTRRRSAQLDRGRAAAQDTRRRSAAGQNRSASGNRSGNAGRTGGSGRSGSAGRGRISSGSKPRVNAGAAERASSLKARQIRRKKQMIRNFAVIGIAAIVVIILIVILTHTISSSRKKTVENSSHETTAEQSATMTTPEEKPEAIEETNTLKDAAGNPVTLAAGDMIDEEVLASSNIDDYFFISEITDDIFNRINGYSFHEGGAVQRSDLAYLRCLHYNVDADTLVGEMIVNKAISTDMLAILKALYQDHYWIERMVLPDEFQADNELVMEANNTSAFNENNPGHEYGVSIDINPLYNPRVYEDGSVEPYTAGDYADRDIVTGYTIEEWDDLYNLFLNYGFTWGGYGEGTKDYMHFEKQY